MHLYLLTRGIKHEVDRFINDLQAQYFPFKYKGKQSFVQLAMRPIQLWEVVMPEDALQTVMNTTFSGDEAFTNNTVFNMLRRSLKAKKIPKRDLSVGKRLVHNRNIAVYPIGIKPDKFNDDGEIL